MSNRSPDRKISDFITQVSVPDGAYFSYVYNNTNYKILDSNFYSTLGVTGTIEQEGAVTGTPILNKSGSVNQIRNLEAGSGIKTSVSPENGATIEHGFTEDTTGVTLLKDITADEPLFRSIVAGAGINVAGTNGQIQIALSAIPVSTKTVIVNSIDDFPAAVAGVITLEDDTEYAIRNDITTSNRFEMGNNTVISGSDNIVTALTYTGTGIMFTASSSSFTIKDITINCTSGTFIDFDGVSNNIMQLLQIIINADILGTVDNVSGARVSGSIFNVTTNGLVFGGVNGFVLLDSNLTTIDAGILYDLGSATFQGLSIINAFVTLNGTSKFLKGLASSGNISAGGAGSVVNSRFFGAGTPLDTITPNDIRWAFFINNTINETTFDALASISNNATATTITTAGVPVVLAGTWTSEHADRFTISSGGRITYDGEKDIEVQITMSFTVAPTAGTNKEIEMFAGKNGTYSANSGASSVIDATRKQRITVVWHYSLSTGDYVEAFAANITDTTDVLVTDACLRVS